MLQTKLWYLGLELILINCLHTQFDFVHKQFLKLNGMATIEWPGILLLSSGYDVKKLN